MRIAIVISTLAGGGAERVLTEMVNAWAQRGWQVTIISWTAGHDEEAYAISPAVIRMPLDVLRKSDNWPSRLQNSTRRLTALRKALRRVRPDVILSFMAATNVTVLLASMGLRFPVVVSERSDPSTTANLSRVWRVLRRLIYRKADLVVAQTAGAGAWLDKYCGVQSIVIPNLLRTLPAPPVGLLRENIILGVGRLVPEKDWETLLRAFALVRARNPGWRLVIVGEGPSRENLERLASDLSIRESTSFPGFTRQPEAHMARAAISVLCSQFEGFPNALLESMAMGAAVVASDCGPGPRELITEGVDGRLFKTGDAEALACLLEKLMENPALRSKMGMQAARVREKFSPVNVMAQWDRALEQVAVRNP